jgi:dienelactone hydrolase
MADDLPGFSQFPFPLAARTLPVYRRGSGPGVLLLHELPGMVPECVRLATSLSDAGFTVFMPLLFGKPGKRNTPAALFCIRKELNLWRAGRSSPLADELRGLCLHISRQPECGPRVGVIGMCLTGGFALVMTQEPCVAAPVLCQPSLPLAVPKISSAAQRGGLDISKSALQAVAERGIPVLGLRFENDWICPKEKFDALQQALGNDQFRRVEFAGKKHSVLTLHYCALPASEQSRAWEEILGHLRAQLVPAGPLPPAPQPRCP